jgi:ribosomal protein S18 acetylase RimI-like enzyme
VADVYLASRRAAAPYIPRTIHADDEVRHWFARVVLVEREVSVAEVGGEIVGVMVLRDEWVDQLYVLGAHQRRGIGSRLLAEAKRQRRVLRLYAFQSNEPARAFYDRHGFRAIAFGDGTGNEEGEPDVLYEWKAPGLSILR